MNRTGWIVIIAAVIVAAVGIWYLESKPAQPVSQSTGTLTGTVVAPTLVAQASYVCDGGKTIQASFYDAPQAAASSTPGQPPKPTGSAQLAFSDGTQVSLKQTISADGARYANDGESTIFWDKGGNALVEVNNDSMSYTNCSTKAQ